MFKNSNPDLFISLLCKYSPGMINYIQKSILWMATTKRLDNLDSGF